MARSEANTPPSVSAATTETWLPTIVLVGFMGSGKSSVARALARDLNCAAIDLDRVVEQRTGRSIADLFAGAGEAAFRVHEMDALVAVLLEDTVKVIASGGGVLTRPANRVLLASARRKGLAFVVYLKATPEVLAARIRRQPGKRPLIDGDQILDADETRARVEQLLAQRAAFYEACADFVVETDDLRPIEVARCIVRRLDAGGFSVPGG